MNTPTAASACSHGVLCLFAGHIDMGTFDACFPSTLHCLRMETVVYSIQCDFVPTPETPTTYRLSPDGDDDIHLYTTQLNNYIVLR
jgi:hypothetical protein